ncbi:MAG: hypothetical protein WKF34_04945 [Pyrinomonadaceae bacterium]
MIFFDYVIRMLDRVVGVDGSFHVLVREPETELESELCGIEKTQVNLIIEHTGAAAERQHPIFIGKRVKAVMVAFDNRERRVQCHPVQQVSQLTQSPTYAADDLAAR